MHKPYSHLIGCCGAGSRYHGNISDLHRQIVIIDERPGPLHFTSLEAVLKCPQVWVTKQPTEQEPGLSVDVVVAVAVAMGMGMGVHVCVPVGVCVGILSAAAVVAGVKVDLGVCGGGGPVSGAIPLAHKVRDAQHGRVEDQVPPAGLGCPLGAGRVRA